MDLSTFINIDYSTIGTFSGSHSLFLDELMVVLTSGFTWIPLYIALFYLVVKNNETMAQVFLVIGCSLLCILLSTGMSDCIAKPLVGRLRPCNDPAIKYSLNMMSSMRNNDYSFFSAHAANTFSIALFFCLLVRNRILSISLISWSLINCYTRLYLGMHFPFDILAGLVWGALVAIVSYLLYSYIYRRISPKINYISTQYTSTGYSLGDIDLVICILFFTYLYTIINSVV